MAILFSRILVGFSVNNNDWFDMSTIDDNLNNTHRPLCVNHLLFQKAAFMNVNYYNDRKKVFLHLSEEDTA